MVLKALFFINKYGFLLKKVLIYKFMDENTNESKLKKNIDNVKFNDENLNNSLINCQYEEFLPYEQSTITKFTLAFLVGQLLDIFEQELKYYIEDIFYVFESNSFNIMPNQALYSFRKFVDVLDELVEIRNKDNV